MTDLLHLLFYVDQVLTQLALQLGYSSRAAYLESHLKFIIDKWLNNGFKITDFPCQMMDYATIADFFQYVLLTSQSLQLRAVFTTFTDTWMNYCFGIYHTEIKENGLIPSMYQKKVGN